MRHGSNNEGPSYGETIGAGDIIAILFDTIKGTLSFSKNGKNFGVAYEDAAFLNGTFLAAVAPIYTGDSFELVQPLLED